MKRFGRVIALSMAAMFLVTGCGGKKDVEKIEISREFVASEVADALIKGVNFQGTLMQCSQEDLYYDFDNLAQDESIMYISPDTYEVVAVLEATNEEAVTELKESVDTFLSDLKDEADTYDEEYSKQVEDAMIVTTENYIIVCVSANTKQARKVIENLFE